MTLSEEDYIKAIYHLGKIKADSVSTNAIAKKMETKPSSVSDMLQKLSDKGLVNYKKYKGVTLTEAGVVTALNLVRKHRLWEVFLVEKLGFTWDEVHEVAEQLEHIKSEKLIDGLDQLLKFPKYDPHGDPIPTKEGELIIQKKKLLSNLAIGESGTCIGVRDSSAKFLNYLDKHNIALGKNISVVDREEFDGSVAILLESKEINISNQIASNLYVKLIP
ncbi:metal-dependent transcriptional regulator [Maribacter sp. HTCC2170]|uniref:metal-dependent transcriptional regulator n=1 Tax=Maribacter sp. (strain HTCC2170 / KCCM 42371) TaxID=313603 RepID=UPI00006BD3E5|nr:metal-dependent transcriptional regulator [Maribacter sp. HTCC2170]EAR02557.1 iron dependent repressor [Maribacter sp. HTCC2170]